MKVTRKVLAGALLLLGTGCIAPPAESWPPDCEGGDSRCVLCVDRAGNGDWYTVVNEQGERWKGCPGGTVMVKPCGGGSIMAEDGSCVNPSFYDDRKVVNGVHTQDCRCGYCEEE